MEGDPKVGDLLGNVKWPPAVRVCRSFRTVSGNSRSSLHTSPSFRKQGRTPRKEGGTVVVTINWSFRYLSRRLPWLILIALWVFLVFRMYSTGPTMLWPSKAEDEVRQLISRDSGGHSLPLKEDKSAISRLAREWIWNGHLRSTQAKSENEKKAPDGALVSRQRKVYRFVNNTEEDFKNFQSLRAGDYLLGNVVGPYDALEEQLLGASVNPTNQSCANEAQFAKFVGAKKVVLILHELSMTGSPLAMMELGSEVLKCGGKVSLVVLDRRGGLLNELVRRKLPILRGKTVGTWKAAAKADLVVAGSAVCAAWIDQYLMFNKRGGRNLVWWIMENRRMYFDRAKNTLHKARTLLFLSQRQAEQWRQWSEEERIKLPDDSSSIVGLSVNDAIASAAGLSDASHGRERVAKLRQAVRKDMGVAPDDMVFLSLSSITPGKGQLYLLHAASVAANELDEARRLKASSRDDMTRPGRYKPMKLVVGSVGSKSNKPEYVSRMLQYLSKEPVLTKSIVWTPATVSVSSLYAAADVYLMNAQGIGETFGRVTVEAMAFGLPVLGTDAGGTKEIVDSNTTGLLHPVGSKATSFLARDMLFLLNNPTLGKQMGESGRNKVKRMYTTSIMFEKLALIFNNSSSSSSLASSQVSPA